MILEKDNLNKITQNGLELVILTRKEHNSSIDIPNYKNLEGIQNDYINGNLEELFKTPLQTIYYAENGELKIVKKHKREFVNFSEYMKDNNLEIITIFSTYRIKNLNELVYFKGPFSIKRHDKLLLG